MTTVKGSKGTGFTGQVTATEHNYELGNNENPLKLFLRCTNALHHVTKKCWTTKNHITQM